ncbi:hypothetical protein CKAH01_16649 [Colletotrichum kahawae]|uniref:Uncharacterized protein n=1 Tax=Colletotrichum kahawae TaxID=34407 RepID=A0AAD9YDF9_COLKA|nr:hypothetical protein CKAH01_16649 [Colletotrichum kahawae]
MRYITLIVATLVGVALTAPVESSTGTVDPYKRVSYQSRLGRITLMITNFGNRILSR